MKILVTGGSASGKSSYAEALAAGLPSPRWYVATMQPLDDECKKRIEKHRIQRSGLGFKTLECPLNLEKLILPERGTVLLECMSNLAANELFDPRGAGKASKEAIARGINILGAQAEHLVVVTNDVFADGNRYDDSTMEYLRLLGELNRQLAADFDEVYEVVCGIPVCHKREACH